MKYMTAAWMILAPAIAGAAEPMRVADNAPTQPRFMSLENMRNGKQPQVKTRENPKLRANLRSDSGAMNNGFFRIDRKTTAPLKQSHAPLIVTPSATTTSAGDAPRIIRGAPEAPTSDTAPTTAIDAAASGPMPEGLATPNNPDPVLALFNNGGGNLPSFRDALGGRAGSQPVTGNMHLWPLPANVDQKLSSAYGYRADPIDKKMEFHSGIDIAAATGTPVMATADGQVTKVGSDPFYGQSIAIMHSDGSESLYGHLSQQGVRVGQNVKAGQVIGAVGATGRVTGAHLDYRLSRNGVTMDPMKVLARPSAIPSTAVASAGVTHVHPATPASTRPRVLAKSERLIVVR